MMNTHTLFLTVALVIPLLGTQCTTRRGDYQDGPGGWGSGGAYNPDQGDFYPLPHRDERYSLYGPGSANVQRDPVAPVFFAFDSSAVAPSEMPKVQSLSQIARQTLIIIAGHTDTSGTLEYNRALGERRALAVRKELLRLGAPSRNIQTISYGEDLSTGRGSHYDRRAEFGALMTGDAAQ